MTTGEVDHDGGGANPGSSSLKRITGSAAQTRQFELSDRRHTEPNTANEPVADNNQSTSGSGCQLNYLNM
jgi:hypothetical protein